MAVSKSHLPLKHVQKKVMEMTKQRNAITGTEGSSSETVSELNILYCLGSRAQTSVFKTENLHVWVQMAQAWPGPVQARPGARFWKSGNLEIQKFGIQKVQKIKILTIQIRSAQNVGKVWISRKKILLAPFGAIPGHFFMGQKKTTCFLLISLVNV